MKKILLVDDDADLCMILGKILNDMNHDVVCVTSAEDALEQLRTNQYSLVITDMCMPTMSGIQLCSIVTKNFPDLKVIVLTGFGSMKTAIEASNAGAQDFLVKPIDADQLDQTINNTLHCSA